MKAIKYIIFLLFCLEPSFSQEIYRVKGEFSMKSRENGFSQLVMGNFFYDINHHQIIYRNHFPEKETWITSDTLLYRIVDGEITETQSIPDFSRFSIFHLALTRGLKNFGIDDKSFTLANVEHENGMVISTYLPNAKYNTFSGKIMLSMIDGKLTGIVFFDKNNVIIKKQFFEDYIIKKGLPFPGRITEITYINEMEYYKVTTYKNIEYNENSADNLYSFDPPEL